MPQDVHGDEIGSPNDGRGQGKPTPLAWIDRHGDVWRLGFDGLAHTRETRPFPIEHVEKKWGPLQEVEW